MRFWDLSSPEVVAADAEPWDGPLAGALRPLSVRAVCRLWLVGTLLAVQSGLIAFLVGEVLTDQMAHPRVLRVLAVVLLGLAVLFPAWVLAFSARALRRYAPAASLVVVLGMGLASTLGAWASGPELGIVVVFYFEALPFAFYVFTLRWAIGAAINAVGGFGVVVLVQEGWSAPAAQWLTVATTVVAVAAILGMSAARADRLAASEHDLGVEIAEVNRTLEARVAAQVTEIERLGELRRFLSPQVADAVLSGEGEAVLRPHRARIAVFFCDLRGFTAFTREAEPEEVVADIDQYYRTVGEVLQRHGATIGGYAGDGIMAYVGDPVPHPEPAREAVQMVAELRGELDGLVAEWQRRGHDLGYGIGVAYGYATLGVVGFDGRFDYTPMGGVVNLAARLCGAAAAGQVLMDHATYAELDGVATGEPVEGLELKGLGAPRAYALT